MFLSLPTLTVLIPLVSLAENYPYGCTSTTSLWFYTLFLLITIPVYAFFQRWTQMAIKLFRYN
ncbi:phosphatidylinositol N-acetylglucosaminyltransferase subunit Y-like [Otolemur garnettii]|uniref:phosphatidylinositol N-acetylglucosaminyltransferase subunit Y-like n=1 Tax=Otolemur garnettii TaxID=30611 RepID=UPI0006446A29|nr:phosphatidylinositol N-acetylglucosaminyltransferase subunit Y-like [Otolemur garnettii]